MTTYTYSQQPAQQRGGGTDVAGWALVAVVVAIVCAGAGWAIARNSTPGRDDVARTSELAAREASARGEYAGYRSGAAAGRRETALQTKLAVAQGRASAQREGFNAGFGDGRQRAQNRAYGFDGGYAGLGAGGAFPSAGYEDILASGLFGADAPGFSDSAYSGLNYGSSATTGYPASGMTGTGIGDDYGY